MLRSIGVQLYKLTFGRRPGTRSQTTCEVRHIPLTVSAGT